MFYLKDLVSFHQDLDRLKYLYKNNANIKNIKSYGYSEYLAAPANPFFKTISEDFDDKDLTSNVSYLGLWEGIGELILSRLADGNMQSPWIYYTHIMDLHTLKPLPEEFNIEKYGKTEYDRRISLIDNWLGKFLKKIDLSKTLVILTADHGERIPYNDKSSFQFEPEFKSVKNITVVDIISLAVEFQAI